MCNRYVPSSYENKRLGEIAIISVDNSKKLYNFLMLGAIRGQFANTPQNKQTPLLLTPKQNISVIARQSISIKSIKEVFI